MALRIDQNSISKGTIDNRKRGITLVTIDFVDGFHLNIELKGNPYRDVAGRLVSFHHPNPDKTLKHDEVLVANDRGNAGDITAARKVKIPTISNEEFAEYYRLKIPFPYVWKNSLYLEWYCLNGGRIVLEASELTITSSEPEWEMTEEIEKQAHLDAQKGLTNFLDMFGNIDASRAELDQTLEKSGDELDEYEWEKLFRHSDKITDRYGELLEKHGDDEEKIDDEMGWNKEPENPEFSVSFDPPEDWESAELDAKFEADMKAQKEHPIRKKAEKLLASIESPRTSNNDELSEIWGALATICAKLAGALSGYKSDGSYDDNGFVIAQMKRVLTYVNEAYELMAKQDHPKKQALMNLRQDIIDLQTRLRGR